MSEIAVTEEEVPEAWKKRDAEMRRIQAAEEADRARARAAELAKVKTTLGIPEKFLALADAEQLAATETLQEVQRGKFEILVLAGDPGRGKTVAAAWWLLQGLQGVQARNRPLFVTAARLSRWERYDGAEMDKLLLASRLVIDDLGNEFNDTKGNFLAVLDEVVADRVANHRPTVITTNLAPEVFKARYGERVRDRIRESGRFQTFAGDSFRGRQMGLLPQEDGLR